MQCHGLVSLSTVARFSACHVLSLMSVSLYLTYSSSDVSLPVFCVCFATCPHKIIISVPQDSVLVSHNGTV